MSVLIEKARKLVGEQTLRDLGKAVPFTRLVPKWYGENDAQEEENGKETA